LSRDGAGVLVRGELDGVEEKAGATVVDGLAGKVGGDRVESLEDAFAGFQRGEREGLVLNDRDGGLLRDPMVEAGVLVVAGVGPATDSV
jgi:hypothetical protein